MQEAYDYRELCFRKWRKAHGLNRFHYWLKHQEARAKLSSKIADFFLALSTAEVGVNASELLRSVYS
jgi:hypothetical protein